MKKILIFGIILLIISVSALSGCLQQTIPSDGDNTQNPGDNQSDDPIMCATDVRPCPDGSYVTRNPALNCEFDQCPTTEVFCTMDAKVCPDGSYVGRNPDNNCEFYACPTTNSVDSNSVDSNIVACTADAMVCSDGSYVGRNPDNNCEFYPCPTND